MSRLLAVTLLLSFVVAPARAQSGPQLTQSVVAGGGGVSTLGALRVEGTVGQSAAGESSGGTFTLAGGFQPVVAALALPALTVTDVTRAEGNSGTITFTFTVSLSAAPQSPVTFDIATSDGTASAASGDYDARGLTGQTIPAGQQSYQFDVAVNGDAAQEPNETFTVTVSNVSGASVQDGAGAATILNDDGAPAAGQIVISEFRLRGPVPSQTPAAGNEQGQLDEFIELYNSTDSDFVVADSAPVGLGADGWAIFSSDDLVSPKYVIPAGTRIPAHGHFLVTNALGYSLSSYAPADNVEGPAPASYNANIPDGAGLALYRTGSPVVASADDLLDSVGFKVTGVPFFEGAGLDPQGGVTAPAEHSFVRRLTSGRPGDTGDNAADFQFVSADGGEYDGAQSSLGAPGPQNSESPAQLNQRIKASLIDPVASAGVPPNSVREPCGDSQECVPTRSQNGTFSIRRRWTNNTGADVTQLRFRLVNVTAGVAPAGTADLRAISSNAVTGIAVTGGGTVTVAGTTLDSTSSSARGGGLNSTLAAGTITPSEPLAPGASVNLQFLLGVQQPGAYRFFVNVEALTGATPSTPAQSRGGAARPKAAKVN